MDAYWFYHEELEEEAALRVGCLFTAIVRLNRRETVRSGLSRSRCFSLFT
jgi:hypothetical protein